MSDNTNTNKVTIDGKITSTLLKALDKKCVKSRPALDGVYFDKGDLVATDSYKAFVVENAVEGGDVDWSVFIPRPIIEGVGKSRFILENLGEDGYRITTLDTVAVWTFVDDVKYVDYDRLFEQRDADADARGEVGLDGTYISDVVKVVKAVTGDARIVMDTHGAHNRPVFITSMATGGVGVKALLMPVRL